MEALFENGPQKAQTYTFEYQGPQEIPMTLKNLIDEVAANCPGSAYLSQYLYMLGSVGNDPYKSGELPLRSLTPLGAEPKEIDAVVRQSLEIAHLEQSLSDAYTGDTGMENVHSARGRAIIDFTKEGVKRLEAALMIDSAGLDANDQKPLLGMDMNLVRAAFSYLCHIPPRKS